MEEGVKYINFVKEEEFLSLFGNIANLFLYTLAINIKFEKFNFEVKTNLNITKNFQQHEQPHLRVELGVFLKLEPTHHY